MLLECVLYEYWEFLYQVTNANDEFEFGAFLCTEPALCKQIKAYIILKETTE